MSTHAGNEGTVKVGSNAVAEIDNFSFQESASPVEDTAMGDTWKTYIAGTGFNEWSGSLECHWDETDTNGQEALTINAGVTLNLYPEGATTGDKYYTGTAIITRINWTVPKDGSTIRRSFDFTGNGVLTLSTVA